MSSQPIPPIVPAADVAREVTEDETLDGRPEEHVDSDGTPVGDADRDEDIRRAGGDPDEDA
jgi:hypothetical protein